MPNFKNACFENNDVSIIGSVFNWTCLYWTWETRIIPTDLSSQGKTWVIRSTKHVFLYFFLHNETQFRASSMQEIEAKRIWIAYVMYYNGRQISDFKASQIKQHIPCHQFYYKCGSLLKSIFNFWQSIKAFGIRSVIAQTKANTQYAIHKIKKL